ncbi:Crp/Fnr family transcriptional regulator [Dyadobacter sp. CY261]|uniref:Crp/Fnr family transcriptional regulator n=1 Tax=Dyadobacter sp. CY261 TaxID=2907203 RepID=UPI001F27D30D|nr:Crp/Fnr family transcriptional regulator [Dyadobacter sp. CY261]MCF0071039.1 Crp/Fnr family transcriptional regulator [Dyadobacter sp. CY261]
MERYYVSLFNYVEQLIVLPETDKASIRESFRPLFVPKNTIIEYAGQIPQYHNFIVTGHMRSFHLDDDNNEITVDLNDGPRFFTSYYHFMHRSVSDKNLHCITDCELLRISRDDVDRTAGHSSTQKDYTIWILQQHLEEDRIRIQDMANITAEARYLKMQKEKPNIFKHVPLRYIASYLGITQRHLSRLRAETGS